MSLLLEDTRQPLVPSRISDLNSRNTTPAEQRKRKRDSIDDITTRDYVFSATTFASSSTKQTYNFSPIAPILRAHVPLAWISTDSPVDVVPSGALLKACITTVRRWSYKVLIARHVSSGRLHAFEEVEENIYACYLLQTWVSTEWIEQATIGATPPVDVGMYRATQSNTNHTRKQSTHSITSNSTPLSTPLSPKRPQNRRGTLARMSILEQKEKTTESYEDEHLDTRSHSEARVCADQHHTTIAEAQSTVKSCYPELIVDSPLIQPDGPSPGLATLQPGAPADLMKPLANGALIPAEPDQLAPESLRRQYLDTLYLQKTSLAFYAKGPLSRARARARVAGSSFTSEQLADFYRDSILPIKKIDIKYKESIQDKIASIHIEHEADQVKTSKSKKKSKKTRLGKNGLWPMEEDFIIQWWKSRDLQKLATSLDERTIEMRNYLSQLRIRETELQIILILETLALEARDVAREKAQKAENIAIDSRVKVESIEGVESVLTSVSTGRNKRDLNSELGILVDRICIWQSIGAGEDTQPSDRDPEQGGNTSARMKDRMKDFCKDVIIPFYGGKLPDQCKKICKELGGPAVSTQRPATGREKAPTHPSPGSSVKPLGRPSNSRTLERVLSEDQGKRHFSPPTLSRSSTIPLVANTQREPSERLTSTGALRKSMSFSNREIDLVADARVTATKRRKLDLVAAQKRELENAIQTLKKPNRTMVARDFMDDVESRTLTSKAVGRTMAPVEISATPRKVKPSSTSRMGEYELPPIPSTAARSEEAVIPSSTTKPRGLGSISSMSRFSSKKRAVLAAIHDSPSKHGSRYGDRLSVEHAEIVGQSDHSISSLTLVNATPTTSRLRPDLPGDDVAVTPFYISQAPASPVLFTPVKRSAVNIEAMFRDVPEIREKAGKIMERAMGAGSGYSDGSIYDSLGWNENDDL